MEEQVITVEASELNIQPGRWPFALNFRGVRYGHPEVHRDKEGDITYVRYFAEQGAERTLIVFND